MMTTAQFRKKIWDFYNKNKRGLPWRNTKNPYFILVSEIMLQQTQVSRVLPKYEQFIKTFPDFVSLSKSSLDKILNIWSGLGYNRRVLYLKKSAEIIVKNYNGIVPKDPLELAKFPGIGKATAASIIVFSFNKPLVFIETNIRRAFIHHFKETLLVSLSSQRDQTEHKIDDMDLLPLIEQTLDRKNPREWYYALMDYGTYLAKIIDNPNKKSKHYTKQSKFEGSLRQVRGKILKILLEEKVFTTSILRDKISTPQDFFESALNQLKKEGFIVIHNEIVSIK